jgi:PAS domain S-box-containing protein
LRLRVLDWAGRIADGSLPLAETLDRVTEAIVPAFAELCTIDTIHDGDVRRIAVRAAGPDAVEIERCVRERTPSPPASLLDPDSNSLDPHFVPAMSEEVLGRLANDPDDLAFLRWLDANSYVVAPLTIRGRRLGALTVARLRDAPRLRDDDVEFIAALASRIAIALDNAGLFSDIESVERRMDSVMENLAEAVIVHDGSGNLLYSNPAAGEQTGFAELSDLTAGKPDALAPRYEIRDEYRRPISPTALPRLRLLRGESPDPFVFNLFDKESGREWWRLEKSTAIRGPSGDVLYAVTTVQDVTAVKQEEFAQRLLADTAEAVVSAADYVAALNALARAVVPQLADWCSIDVPGAEGRIEQIAVSEEDPALLELDRRLRQGFEVRPGLTLAMDDVLRASKPLTAQLPAEPTPGWVLLKPIRAGDAAIGVMTLVNRVGRRAFSVPDIRLARAVADRAGVAILNARLASERAEIAETLQRELMPPVLPEVDGWSMAAMYRPAGAQIRAGGDFYDVFEAREGWTLVVGDVEGHGAEAAAMTAMVRHTIRTAARFDGDVIAALEMLNSELRDRDRVRLCSVVCVSFGPGEEATVISAGHPLPLLVSSGRVREVGLPGSLLGALEEPQWSPVRFVVNEGEELIVYTDGVVEARSNGGRFGRERLGALLGRIATPGETVQRVEDALSEFAETLQDDAAMLVMRREGPRQPSLAVADGAEAAAAE